MSPMAALQFKQLHEYKASKRLVELASAPYDLTLPGSVTPERLARFESAAAGWRLLYGLERIDEQVMSALMELAKEAELLEKMDALQSGEPINSLIGIESENRPALHTALRDLFQDRRSESAAKEASDLARQEIERLDRFFEQIDREGQFDDLLFIGIGGSELGPKMLYEALAGYRKEGRRVHFISNVDPDEVAQKVGGLNLKRTLFAVVSKSGGTLETATNERLVRERFAAAGLDPSRHAIVITVPGSPMDDPGRFLERFHMWNWVGGRYCATSAVGGVAIGFAVGMEPFHQFLHGAHQMDLSAREPDLEENLPLLGALLGIWNRNFLRLPTLAIIPYSQMMWRFSAHIQQLDMESNGKHVDRHGRPIEAASGPVIWGEPGTNGQHSFFQLIHQGTDTIPIEFIGFRESQWSEDLEVDGTTSQEKLVSNMLAQGLALAMGQESDNPNRQFEGNRPSLTLFSQRLEPRTLGALLSYYENKVDFQGFTWGNNSFDQEGVQLGKVLARRIIGLFGSRRGGPSVDPYPVGEALINQLYR